MITEAVVWRPVPDWPRYEVSSDGRVRHVDGDEKPQHKDAKGYQRVSFSSKVFLVHRLIALAFIGPPPEPPYRVHHLDGDKENNTPTNLKWVAPRDFRPNLQHGLRNTRPWSIWKNMRKRCYDTNSASYPRYGGRGIRVCAAWRKSFEAFWSDMAPGYSPDLTIERINNSGPYEPGNCRWATPKEQAKNRRDNHILETPWGRMTLGEAAEKVGINRATLWKRIMIGYSQADLFEPPHRCKNRIKRGRLMARSDITT